MDENEIIKFFGLWLPRWRVSEISAKGGRAVQQWGTGFRFRKDDPKLAGYTRKGGLAATQDKEHVQRITSRGGKAAAEWRAARRREARVAPQPRTVIMAMTTSGDWPRAWPPFYLPDDNGVSHMSLQARMSEHDSRLYDPNRDIAHNFRFVVEHIAKRMDEGRWDIATEVANVFHVTPDDLGEACAGFIRFVAGAAQKPKETMTQCLDRSGFLKAKPAAQLLHLAYLGSLLAGVYYRGAKEATIKGNGPCADLDDYVADGVAASRLIGKRPVGNAPTGGSECNQPSEQGQQP